MYQEETRVKKGKDEMKINVERSFRPFSLLDVRNKANIHYKDEM